SESAQQYEDDSRQHLANPCALQERANRRKAEEGRKQTEDVVSADTHALRLRKDSGCGGAYFIRLSPIVAPRHAAPETGRRGQERSAVITETACVIRF